MGRPQGVSFAALWKQRALPVRSRGGRSSGWKDTAGVEGRSLGAASADLGGGKREGRAAPESSRRAPPRRSTVAGGRKGGSEGACFGEQYGTLGRLASLRRSPGPGGRGAGPARGRGAGQRTEPLRSDPDPGGLTSQLWEGEGATLE